MSLSEWYEETHTASRERSSGSTVPGCWPLHAVATVCNVGMIALAALRGEYGFMWTATAAACYALAETIRAYQANAPVRRSGAAPGVET